jgi:hypothetical protein
VLGLLLTGLRYDESVLDANEIKHQSTLPAVAVIELLSFV